MTIKDFNKIDDNTWVSKERFWFENDKVKFWYRWYILTYVYQPEWNANVWKTRYQTLLVVDTESIHEKHRKSGIRKYEKSDILSSFDIITFGFFFKEVERKGMLEEDYLDKIIVSTLKLKIENKIKVDKYQQIRGIISGNSFFHY